jgi:hypothetical protein
MGEANAWRRLGNWLDVLLGRLDIGWYARE